MSLLKRGLCVVLCWILGMGLVSCSSQEKGEIYNASSITLEMQDYVVIQRNTTTPICVNKKTGISEMFFSDPLTNLDTSPFFLRYTKVDNNTVAMTDGRAVFSIYQVDLESLYWHDKQGLLNGAKTSYLGAEDLFPSLRYGLETDQQLSVLCGMFTYPDGFLMARSFGVYSMKTGQKSKAICIREDAIAQRNTAFDGQAVYYITEDNELISLTVDTNERQVLYEGVTDFRLTERGALLLCGRDLLVLDLDGGGEAVLVSGAGAVLGGTDDYVYYCDTTGFDGNEGRLYRMKWDGSATEVLPVEGYFHTLGIVSDPQWLFFYGKDGLTRCNYDGTEVTLVERND